MHLFLLIEKVSVSINFVKLVVFLVTKDLDAQVIKPNLFLLFTANNKIIF